MQFNKDIHAAVIANYRRMFEETNGVPTILTDEEIFHIFDTVYVDTTSAEQDIARVTAMEELEAEKAGVDTAV